MKNWEGDDTDTYCPAAKDMADAQACVRKTRYRFTHGEFC